MYKKYYRFFLSPHSEFGRYSFLAFLSIAGFFYCSFSPNKNLFELYPIFTALNLILLKFDESTKNILGVLCENLHYELDLISTY